MSPRLRPLRSGPPAEGEPLEPATDADADGSSGEPDPRRPRMRVRSPAPYPGSWIVTASWVGTAVFVVTAVAGAIDPDPLGDVAAGVAWVLFGLGSVGFLWAYVVAVARSRTDAIGIGGLFFLQDSAPSTVQRRLLLSLAVQVAAALATAAARPFTNSAFGILVPIYGLGLAGLWGARHGKFEERVEPPSRERP